MNTPFAYNPEIQPDAEAWLALDEQERIWLVEKYHRRAKIELPRETAHAALHAIVENQIAMDFGPVVRAFPRLMKQGLSRHDAIHAVASVLTDLLSEQASGNAKDSGESVEARYGAEVERLSAKEWLTRHDGQ